MDDDPIAEPRANGGNRVESKSAAAPLSAAETRLAELDAAAERPSRLTSWQFGLRQALVLLSVVAIYLGMSRSLLQWLIGLPDWMDITAGVVLFIWLIVLTIRTGSRVGLWREGRQRQQARREALLELIEEKRGLKKTTDSAAADDGRSQ